MRKATAKHMSFIALASGFWLVFLFAEAMANIGPFGGEVHTVTIDPMDPSTLYSGTPGGGGFQSKDGGAYWSEINTGLGDLRVRSFAIDPASTRTVYVGTLRGVYKSTDAGGHWTEIDIGRVNPAVYSLAIDPTDTNTVYASADG